MRLAETSPLFLFPRALTPTLLVGLPEVDDLERPVITTLEKAHIDRCLSLTHLEETTRTVDISK
jgi:hypothetical protein